MAQPLTKSVSKPILIARFAKHKLIFIEPFTTFATKLTCPDHLFDYLWRRVLVIPEFVSEIFHNNSGKINPTKIIHLKGAHGIVETEFYRCIDVFEIPESFPLTLSIF